MIWKLLSTYLIVSGVLLNLVLIVMGALMVRYYGWRKTFEIIKNPLSR